MYHQEILTPLKMYRSFLRNEHAGNSVEAFDELFRRSGVDPAANAALVLAMPVVFPQLVAGLDERVPLPWKGRVRPSVAVLFSDKGAEERIKVLVNAVFKGDK